MPYFDRTDIIDAYLALEYDYNVNGILPERTRHFEGLPPVYRSAYTQACNMGYVQSPLAGGFNRLTSENAKEIYLQFVTKHKLDNDPDI